MGFLLSQEKVNDMTTDCPQCDEIQEKTQDNTRLCLAHQLADARHEMHKWMDIVEEIKKQIEREKEDVSTSTE